MNLRTLLSVSLVLGGFTLTAFNNCSQMRGVAAGQGGAGILASDSSGNPSSTPLPTPTPTSAAVDEPKAIQAQNYVMTFEDEFRDLSDIALSANPDPTKRWFSGNDSCCLSTTDGSPANMFPYSAGSVPAIDPYVALTGGGLGITLTKSSGAWFTGILTTVDNAGQGFAQKYGYFEMQATMPAGPGVWPAFWLLNQGSRDKSTNTIGEIDVVEYYGVSKGNWYFSTLHNWSGGGQGLPVGTATSDQTSGVHKYGMLWDRFQIRFYFDDQIIGAQPTYDVMNEPYFMLINNGLGGGWPTDQTISPSTFQIKSIRAWAATAASPEPVAPTWIQCAAEGNTCAFTGKRNLRYGKDTFIQAVGTDGISCNDKTFGDTQPAPGKFCYYTASTIN